jgi:hypothetical protein
MKERGIFKLILFLLLVTISNQIQEIFPFESAAPFQFGSILNASDKFLRNDLFVISEEVIQGKLQGKTIIALESTVISHGKVSNLSSKD